MMRWLVRVPATAFIVASASMLFWHYAAIPYRCNLRLRQQMQDVELVFSMAANSVRSAQVARRTAEDLRPCLSDCADNVGLLMVLAASYRALDRNQEAIGTYETALRYDRRPELYLNLGQAQLANGNSQAALQNLTLACIYNPAYLDEIVQNHAEIKNAVDLYQTRLFARRRPD